MNCIQKKLWLAWSKFRFLRMPVERRVRLEVTTDGRHITFLLVSLYEAGYGVHVVGSPFVFRELIGLRKSVPLQFVIGGKERECGISISDKSGFNHNRKGGAFEIEQQKVGPKGEPSGSERVKGHRDEKRILLDYDFFSGLNKGGASNRGTANTEVGEDLGKNESRENFNHGLHEYARIEAEQAGLRLAGQAGAEFSNPFTIKLAQDSENTSPTRSANDPASSAEQPRTDIGGLISDKSEVAMALDSDRRPNAGHSLKEWSGVFEGISPSSLGSMPSKTPPAPAPGVPALASSSVLIREIRGQKSGNLDFPPQALRMPYFMHPSVYHRGLHKRRSPITALDTRYALPVTRHSAEGASASHPLPVTSYPPQRRRRFRIGFFGTHDREFYTKHYHFSGMNRFEILEVFLQKFDDRITHLQGGPKNWNPSEIAVSIDSRGGDRRGKSFLSQDHYFEVLRECDFVLSPPGICMPVSHNLIEAMFCGAVPITNGGAFMAEPLKNGETCLEFQNAEGLVSVIERALSMDEREVEQVRNSMRDYYDRFLEPRVCAETFLRSHSSQILVNAEEKSLPQVY